MFRPRLLWFWFLALLMLAACSGSTPRMIASYPSNSSQPPAYRPPVPIAPAQIVYNADIDLAVGDVEAASSQAESLAWRYGGYLDSSETWYQDGKRYATLVLAVPVSNYDGLHSALLGLGTLKSERVTGDLVDYGSGGYPNYSHISLHLQPDGVSLPSLPATGWDPLGTLKSAFAVFVTIFGFLVDILIWILVVAGPFVLIGWIAIALYRRSKRA